MSAVAPRWKLTPKRLHEPLLRTLLRSSVFLACVVLLCEKLLLPLEVPALTVVSQLAAQLEMLSGDAAGRGKTPTLAVLKIDRETFRKEFGGTQPLNRCVLKGYIADLLKARPHLKHLAIDLDLSDTGVSERDPCGGAILELLKAAKSSGVATTLILPIDAQDRLESAGWRRQVSQAGLALADPRVVREFGVVRAHWQHKGACPTLGQALAIAPPAATSVCVDPGRDLPDAEMDSGTPSMVAYHKLVRDAWVAEPGKDGKLMRLTEQIAALGMQPQEMDRVILGAHFDESDEHLTPIGLLAGVEVHAAVALAPSEKVNHALGLVLDIGVGVLCGFGAHWLWTRYFRQLLGHGCEPPTVSGQWLAYRWLVLLLLIWLVLALLVLPTVALVVLQAGSTWINPVPMLVGMTIDAFVLSSVGSAIHHSGHSATPVPDPQRSRLAEVAACVQARVPALLWWSVVVFGVLTLLKH